MKCIALAVIFNIMNATNSDCEPYGKAIGGINVCISVFFYFQFSVVT